MLTEQNRTLQAGAELLRAGALGASSAVPRMRLEEMAEFYEVTLEAMLSGLRNWRQRQRT
ncbi:MAG: hypothetical protein ACR2IK_18430 [Chloroflexota bacterium]